MTVKGGANTRGDSSVHAHGLTLKRLLQHQPRKVSRYGPRLVSGSITRERDCKLEQPLPCLRTTKVTSTIGGFQVLPSIHKSVITVIGCGDESQIIVYDLGGGNFDNFDNHAIEYSVKDYNETNTESFEYDNDFSNAPTHANFETLGLDLFREAMKQGRQSLPVASSPSSLFVSSPSSSRRCLRGGTVIHEGEQPSQHFKIPSSPCGTRQIKVTRGRRQRYHKCEKGRFLKDEAYEEAH
ncbi:hypothetical protein DENSPDRAFT_846951 [Dentipellis sp. KUC8613]|nr:hypothetical protein DENSPDRAFT_846951 [Dentipellis sp. KUC8613]